MRGDYKEDINMLERGKKHRRNSRHKQRKQAKK